ncbi:MAG: tRNA (adenosine(37)-N6)-threonylcarbamoyltransferase complex dimerization subunit type 1 TsaB [Polyangia bacterium]|jgi:tRNA threonylcarbamoyladenosine biosynthesis protein TsaB
MMMNAPLSLTTPVLALDTATPTARVAMLSPAGECLVAREQTAARHSANLLALCDEVLRATSVKVGDLGAIVCGAGPGSFTGLRVGLAVAKGLAMPTGVKLVLVSSLEALAQDLALRAPEAGLLLPCLDAGKGQVYARLYRVENGVHKATAGTNDAPDAATLDDADWLLSPPELVDLLRASVAHRDIADARVAAGGTGIDRHLQVFRDAMGNAALSAVAGPSALAGGRLGLARLAQGLADDIATAVPRYGRPPDITRPKKTQPPPGPVNPAGQR